MTDIEIKVLRELYKADGGDDDWTTPEYAEASARLTSLMKENAADRKRWAEMDQAFNDTDDEARLIGFVTGFNAAVRLLGSDRGRQSGVPSFF